MHPASPAATRARRPQAIYAAAATKRMSTNHVQMHLSCFGMLSPYATFADEIAHWARHPFRLNRDFSGKRFGNEGYASRNSWPNLGRRNHAPRRTPDPHPKTKDNLMQRTT